MNPHSFFQGRSLPLYLAFFLLFSGVASQSQAQQVTLTPDQIRAITPDWKGERSADGRPHVSDRTLERLKHISTEEAWGILRGKGYQNQFEGDWMVEHVDSPMTGRAVTAQYMPSRPDLQKVLTDKGKAEGRVGAMNSWPIDVLKNGDIYVADSYGKIVDGTLIGDNLGNSIYAHSQRGVVFYGSVRDIEGLDEINGFNSWVKGIDPSYIQQMMLGGINVPIRIGRATVLPGDVVMANKEGVVFIPAQFADSIVIVAEFIELRDEFGHLRLRQQKYTPGQIDAGWSDEIKKDFLQWINDNPDKLPMTRQELDAYMKSRTW
jgi:4-hydroxy-4-methyl-2-oxoglutarate aldolase